MDSLASFDSEKLFFEIKIFNLNLLLNKYITIVFKIGRVMLATATLDIISVNILINTNTSNRSITNGTLAKYLSFSARNSFNPDTTLPWAKAKLLPLKNI